MRKDSVRETSSGAAAGTLDRDRDIEVKQFVEALARSVTMGDGRAAVRFWEIPALVVADAFVRPVTTNAEVEEHFSTVKHQYYARGIVDTQPDVLSLEWITDRIAVVRVRWPYLDANGDERGEETMTYTLRRDDAGNLRLRAAIVHGEAPKH
jgi:hypothetical protein